MSEARIKRVDEGNIPSNVNLPRSDGAVEGPGSLRAGGHCALVGVLLLEDNHKRHTYLRRASAVSSCHAITSLVQAHSILPHCSNFLGTVSAEQEHVFTVS
jgi:hypothetical protein